VCLSYIYILYSNISRGSLSCWFHQSSLT
jgi:hypothetical protein